MALWITPQQFPKQTTFFHEILVDTAEQLRSMGATFRSFLKGPVKQRYNLVFTDLEMARLMDDFNYLPVESLQNEMQKFYAKMILSPLSKPQFAVVAWTRHPLQPSGIRVGGVETTYPCIRTGLSVFCEYR
ncbi:hypothetical protein BKA56DRAFT_675805 [Ilyonectria sp. MPI-CAGE-AT-0026]|nr:hypothetical protein BKA56DRAFT_675805 [Ilyonectria sp. MPI-CAGE-AT-0026]